MYARVALFTSFLLLLGAGGATGHSGLALGGVGTASVDGVVAPRQWASATVLPFAAALPGGGSVAATLRVMNDGANLYLGVTVARAPVNGTVAFVFDNDHDGSGTEQGDDGLAFGSTTLGLNDNVRSALPPCPPGSSAPFATPKRGERPTAPGRPRSSTGRPTTRSPIRSTAPTTPTTSACGRATCSASCSS